MKQIKLLPLFLVLNIHIAILNADTLTPPLQNHSCPEFPNIKPQEGPLALLNCDMHKAYEVRVKQLINSFGSPGGRPIILNLGGALVLKYNGKTETVLITPDNFQDLKVFNHGVLAVFLVLSQNKEGSLNQDTLQKLNELGEHLLAAKKSIPTLKIEPKAASAAINAVTITENFVQSTIKNKTWTNAGLEQFYTNLSQSINELLFQAAIIELDALDLTINRWLSKMSSEEKKQIGIVVATAHQARADEISLQYFAKKFGKHFDVGAKGENGLVVLEEKFDEDSAVKALARHYLDREIGQMIFKYPESMQQDFLAGAALRILQSHF